MKSAAIALSVFALISLAGCTLPASSGNEASGTVFLWISSDKDTYVSCGAAGPPCPEENQNFGTNGSLVVARNGVAVKQTYVHFGIPTFPEGTTIEEAYFELYHSGQNEDGQTDDINVPVSRAVAAWSPELVTYATQPNQLTGGEFTLKLHSMDWSGSPDIKTIVNGWVGDPSTNYGFHVYWDTLTPGVEKGFYSNNDIRRKVDDLGLAPRLLIKIVLPDGKTTNDMSLPALPADNDLPFEGQAVLMVRFKGGSDWPADWNVKRGT